LDLNETLVANEDLGLRVSFYVFGKIFFYLVYEILDNDEDVFLWVLLVI